MDAKYKTNIQKIQRACHRLQDLNRNRFKHLKDSQEYIYIYMMSSLKSKNQ